MGGKGLAPTPKVSETQIPDTADAAIQLVFKIMGIQSNSQNKIVVQDNMGLRQQKNACRNKVDSALHYNRVDHGGNETHMIVVQVQALELEATALHPDLQSKSCLSN